MKYSDALNNTLMQQANWNATNTSYTTWAIINNGTMASWANVVNGTMLSYAQALNNTLMQQANWNATNTSYRTLDNNTYVANLSAAAGIYFLGNITCNSITGGSDSDFCVDSGGGGGISWAEAINGTLLKYSDALNGTLASTIAANTFGNFNQTFNGTTLFLWALLNRIGIGTTSPQNTLNIIGDINATTIVWSEGKNLSKGYDYAINSTGGGVTWADVNNGTMLNYSNALNGSVEVKWNANATNFTTIYGNTLSNYTNQTVIYGYTLNGTFSSGISWATANNGTLLNYSSALNNTLMQQANWNATNTSYTTWAIITNGTMLSYAQALNNTLMQQANWNATNTSYRTLSNLTFVGNGNFTGALTSENLKIASCDVKAYEGNGTIYCGTDAGEGGGITWATAYNGTLAKTDAANTFGNFNQTFNGTTFFINAIDERVGVGTTAPTVVFDVVGTINASQILVNGTPVSAGGISWATANNGTLLNYSSALNGTLAQWSQVGNGTVAFWSNVVNGTMLSYAQALNNTLMQQANWNATNTSYTTWAIVNNGTMLNYSSALNGTLASTIAANTFGNFNQTFNGTTFFINAIDERVGVGTTAPTVVFDVVGTINASQILVNGTPVSAGGISWAEAINGTLLKYSDALNNTLMQQANWNATNTSYTTWAIVTNGTMLSYAQALNNTLMQQANWNATNTSYADLNKANVFLNFNQTMNGTTFFLWSLLNRIGIGTTSPVNTLNVVGDINATTDIWAYRTLNLTSGYLYATNSTYYLASNPDGYINWATANNGTLLNYSSALNGTLATWANVVNGTMASWAQVTNGTMLSYAQALNGTLATWANVVNGTVRATTNLTFYGGNVGVNLTSAQSALNVRGNFNVSNVSLYQMFYVNEDTGNITIGPPASNTSIWNNGTGLCIGGC